MELMSKYTMTSRPKVIYEWSVYILIDPITHEVKECNQAFITEQDDLLDVMHSAIKYHVLLALVFMCPAGKCN